MPSLTQADFPPTTKPTIKKNVPKPYVPPPTPKVLNWKLVPNSFYDKVLDVEEYRICRLRGNENPSTGRFLNFNQRGTYYCACCGGDYALFSSKSKYNSKTGWPSFYEPIHENSVALRPVVNAPPLLKQANNEVVCFRCNSHLGYFFNYGPTPSKKQYIINSTVLTFTPEGSTAVRTFPAPPPS